MCGVLNLRGYYNMPPLWEVGRSTSAPSTSLTPTKISDDAHLGLLEKQLSIRMNIMKTNMFVSILYTVSATYNTAYIRPGYYIIRLSIFRQKGPDLKIYLFLYTNRNVDRFQDPIFLANLRVQDHIFPTLSYGCFHILILDLDHWFGAYYSNDFDYGRKTCD